MFGLYQRRGQTRTAEEAAVTGPEIRVRAAELRQQELAEAVAVREQAISILGHELRNPLSAIAAVARATLWRDDLPGDVRDRLMQMDRAAQRSLVMIDMLRDFAEIRWRGTLLLHPERADLVSVIMEILDELRAAHPSRAIALDAREACAMVFDPVRMGQVVANLVGNALVHGSPDKPVQVLLVGGDDEVSLAVTNQGPAIPPERVPRLFEPFNHGNDNGGDLQRPRGLGLGLYIVRVIVTAHGGSVAVESRGGSENTFVVRLPRR